MTESPDFGGPPGKSSSTRRIAGAAHFDVGGVYRYRLTRVWDDSGPNVAWVMLNPATATATRDDATIRRVVGFSRAWGYGSADVVNLFALRSADPTALLVSDDPVGPDNDGEITGTIATTDRVIVAWGNNGTIPNRRTGAPRCQEVRRLIEATGQPVACLALTRQGQPRHPLYMPARTRPIALS